MPTRALPQDTGADPSRPGTQTSAEVRSEMRPEMRAWRIYVPRWGDEPQAVSIARSRSLAHARSLVTANGVGHKLKWGDIRVLRAAEFDAWIPKYGIFAWAWEHVQKMAAELAEQPAAPLADRQVDQPAPPVELQPHPSMHPGVPMPLSKPDLKYLIDQIGEVHLGVQVNLEAYLSLALDESDLPQIEAGTKNLPLVLAGLLRRQIEDMSDEDLATMIEGTRFGHAMEGAPSDGVGRDLVALAKAACEANGVRLVEAQEPEIAGHWDWIHDTSGMASQASLSTEAEAAFEACRVMGVGLGQVDRGQDRRQRDQDQRPRP